MFKLIITLLFLLNLNTSLVNCSKRKERFSVEPFGVLEARSDSDVITTCKKRGTFALTFDDGPYIHENQISNYLSNNDAKGTFFVNGNNYGCIYDDENVESLRRTFAQGHIIGSHTWSHAHITELSEEELVQELDLLEIALKKILGIKPRLFRPPYGEYNDLAIKVLKSRGYTIVNWSLDSGDSVGASPDESISRYQESAKHYPTPQIGLNHETQQETASTVIPHVVPILLKAGYKLVSLPNCLGLTHYYDKVGEPQERDGTWTCNN